MYECIYYLNNNNNADYKSDNATMLITTHTYMSIEIGIIILDESVFISVLGQFRTYLFRSLVHTEGIVTNFSV